MRTFLGGSMLGAELAAEAGEDRIKGGACVVVGARESRIQAKAGNRESLVAAAEAFLDSDERADKARLLGVQHKLYQRSINSCLRRGSRRALGDASSLRNPAITILAFSAAEFCRRVARRISRTVFSAASECNSAFDLIARSFAVNMSPNLSLLNPPILSNWC